jgi:hypothetical protein
VLTLVCVDDMAVGWDMSVKEAATCPQPLGGKVSLFQYYKAFPIHIFRQWASSRGCARPRDSFFVYCSGLCLA